MTLEALREVFQTPAWADLHKDGSRIVKLLESDVFCDKNSGKISANHLILFGFLNCPGDAVEKSFMLYSVFQDGSFVKQSYLSASDKDIEPAIKKLVLLCTLELAQLMKEVDGIITPAECRDSHSRKIISSCDGILEYNYLDPIYEMKSKLAYEEWCTLSCQKPEICKVFYYPEKLRSLAFTRAGVDFEGKDKFLSWCAKKNVKTSDEY